MKKLFSYYLFLLFFLGIYSLHSQTLTISSTGQTSSPSTNWSISGSTLTVTGTANIRASVIVNALASGNLSVVGNSTNFAVTVSEAITATGNNTLAVGSATNTGTITFNAVTSFAGPVTLYGGSINMDQNMTCTSSGSPILLQSTGAIDIAASRTVQSNGGNITLRSNSGGTALTNASSIILNSGSSLLSQGGNITLGGNFTGAQGTGLYATSGNAPAINISGATISAAGGNIKLYGKCNGNYDDGIRLTGTINTTGIGSIELYGEAYGGVTGAGDAYYGGVTFGNANSLVSTVNGNLTIEGILTNTSSSIASGLNFYRIAGGTGTLSIELLSKTGNVQVSGQKAPSAASFGIGQCSQGDVYIGSPKDNSWTASGNIVMSLSSFDLAAATGIIFKTTGALNVEPYDASFNSTITFPFTNNSSISGVSAFTMGKASNTANITIGAPGISVAGPITLYGGALSLGANITSTAGGEIALYSDAALAGLSSARSMTTTGAFRYLPQGTSFSSTVTFPITNLSLVNITELQLGKSGNTAGITIGSSATIAGPISIYGGYVNINGNLTSSANGDIFIKGVASTNPSILLNSGKTITKSGGTGTLTFQGHGRVQNSGTITTSGTGVLNLVLWSDFDNSNNDGGVSHMGTISTNSGHVWMGGSSSNGGSYTWNGLTVGDGPSIGTTGFNNNGLDLFGNITTAGGDFLAWAGNGALSSNVQGIGNGGSGDVVNVGTGDIILITDAVSGTTGDAVYFRQNGGSFTLVPNGGDFGATFNWNPGIESVFSGTNNGYNLGTGNFNFLAIENPFALTSFTVGRYDGMLSGSAPVVMTNSSNITISTATTFGGSVSLEGGTITLNANLTTTNNGDISLYTDAAIGGLTAARTITVAGSFNYIPRSDFFSAPVTYPITNLNLTSAGLLIGKLSNTAAITFGNATTIAGPITAYGGTVTLNANLTTTNNGNIALYTDNPLGGLSTARTLTAAGAFKYIPRATTFTADVTYPITNLTATSTGLTIGKTTNDKNITINADVTGGAGIELYGNNVNINANLKTISGGAMYLKGITTIAAGKYIESNGAFTHDGNMTFKSDATGTAAFGTLGGTFTTVSGTATVERYFPAKRVFRFVSSAVTTTSNIRTNWQENGGTAAGLGTHITGVNGVTNGFDTTTSNNPSMFTFNNTSAAWVPVTSTISNTLTAGVPYRVNIRGDRTLDLSTNIPPPTITTLRATGALATGPINAGTLSASAYAYNFIGNPYQAPVNMKMALDAATNLNNVVYYVWDPKMNTRGAYISVDLTTTNGTPNNGSSYANKYLQPGQACFVRTGATAGAASLNFQEIYKAVDAPNQLVFKNTAQDAAELSNIRLNLYDSNSLALNLSALDGLLVFFDDAYSNDVDQNDGGKFANPDEMLSTYNSGALVSIEKRMQPTTNDILPLRISQYRGTDYTLVAQGTNLNGVPAYLHDQFLQTYTEIPQSGSINYPFSIVTANTQTTATDRFRIVYTNPLLSTNNTEWMHFTLYPNPSKQGNFNINFPQLVNSGKVTIYNTLGEKVHTQDLNATIQTAINPNKPLATGIYYVEIEIEANKTVKKLIIE